MRDRRPPRGNSEPAPLDAVPPWNRAGDAAVEGRTDAPEVLPDWLVAPPPESDEPGRSSSSWPRATGVGSPAHATRRFDADEPAVDEPGRDPDAQAAARRGGVLVPTAVGLMLGMAILLLALVDLAEQVARLAPEPTAASGEVLPATKEPGTRHEGVEVRRNLGAAPRDPPGVTEGASRSGAGPAPTEAPGMLTIRSNRPARVFVDGREVGVTPRDLSIGPGVHTVRAVLVESPASEKEVEARVEAAGHTARVEFRF